MYKNFVCIKTDREEGTSVSDTSPAKNRVPGNGQMWTIHRTCSGWRLPYRNVLENLVHETGAQNLVRFMGGKNKDELRKYYQQADIFVFPSLWEGMPNVVLEAMACGLPIIMTPCEGSRELVTDNGIITTAEELSDNLVKLCTDSGLRASMGRNSIRNVERDFRWENIGERYLEILGK